MTRHLSHTEAGGRIVERAGSGQPIAMNEHEIRERCRTAPEWVRRHMDARREARGLRPLWGSRAQGRRAAATGLVSRMRSFLAMTRARLSR
jgi:hypothetical protein